MTRKVNMNTELREKLLADAIRESKSQARKLQVLVDQSIEKGIIPEELKPRALKFREKLISYRKRLNAK